MVRYIIPLCLTLLSFFPFAAAQSICTICSPHSLINSGGNIISPGANDVVPINSTYLITVKPVVILLTYQWYSNASKSSTVSISVNKNDTDTGPLVRVFIAGPVNNTGSYTWFVNNTVDSLVGDNDCRIEMNPNGSNPIVSNSFTIASSNTTTSGDQTTTKNNTSLLIKTICSLVGGLGILSLIAFMYFRHRKTGYWSLVRN